MVLTCGRSRFCISIHLSAAPDLIEGAESNAEQVEPSSEKLVDSELQLEVVAGARGVCLLAGHCREARGALPHPARHRTFAHAFHAFREWDSDGHRGLRRILRPVSPGRPRR